MMFLPHWHLTDNKPAFIDSESGTVIRQTARVYGAMQELIKEYNEFADETNKILETFQGDTKENQKCFVTYINTLIENFINTVNTEIDKQNLKIGEDIEKTTANIIEQKIKSGEFNVGVVYNEETENLEIVVTEGV